MDQLLLLSNNQTTPSSILRVQLNKKLVQIVATSKNNDESGGGYTCHFADGTQSDEPYDVIVGAEGINSLTQRYVQNRHFNANDKNNNGKTAIYSGIRIRYAVVDGTSSDDSSNDSSTAPSSSGVVLRQHFGRGAYALSGVYGTGAQQPAARCAFIVYLDPEYWGPFRRRQQSEQPQPPKQSEPQPPKPSSNTAVSDDENADWSQDNRQSVEIARRKMLQQLDECGIPSTTEVGQYIAAADRFFELGSYFHNPFGKWSRDGLVLVGDAAHALPPFLGQGSNQAIQDAHCLVQQIFAYNAAVHAYNNNNNNNTNNEALQATDDTTEQPPQSPPILQDYWNEYEKKRWPSTFGVFWKSVFLGYLETGGIHGFYAPFRNAFFKLMGALGVAERILLDAATPKL